MSKYISRYDKKISVIFNGPKTCTTDRELVKGAEFVDGQFIYRYMQEGSFDNWVDIETDGWGVMLQDKESTEDVETQVCSTINGKPVVSMSYMFHDSKATLLNLTSFDTVNITNMSYMFSYSEAPSLDFAMFDTSNVTNMEGMFKNSKLETIDISLFITNNVVNMNSMFDSTKFTSLDLLRFETTNVEDMSYMFNNSKINYLDLTSFDTSKVTSMKNMFSSSAATTIDLTSFVTSNVEDMSYMFNNISSSEINIRNFDTTKVKDMRYMFEGTNFEVVDLSSFDMANVENTNDMFTTSTTPVGYAKTANDALILNNTLNKPDALIFITKKACTFGGELSNNTTYTSDKYTYKYIPATKKWNIEIQKGDITDTNLCTIIDNMPVIIKQLDGYYVLFEQGSGSGGTKNTLVQYNTAMPSIKIPTREGYSFTGYYTENNAQGEKYYNSDGSSAKNYDIQDHLILYANYEANKYTITLDKQGGNSGSDTLEATYDSLLPSMTIPKKTNYVFDGYYTETEGKGTLYYDGYGNSKIIWKSTNPITLYAKWNPANLYQILQLSAEDGQIAKEYTSSHKDSFTEDGTYDVYYFNATNTDSISKVSQKNNVIFAGHCWQMLRTTDTGGIKLIYNGEPTSDGKCTDDRTTHVGYASETTTNLSSQYYYADAYTYDNTKKKFKLSGTITQNTWNNDTYINLLYKYTCKDNTSETKECDNLYLISEYYDSSNAYVIPLNFNSHYTSFGTIKYNRNPYSINTVGYMYPDNDNNRKTLTESQLTSYIISSEILALKEEENYCRFDEKIVLTQKNYALNIINNRNNDTKEKIPNFINLMNIKGGIDST